MQIRRPNGPPFFLEEGRCRDENPRARSDLSDLDRRVRVEPLANANGDVHPFIDEIDASIGRDELHAEPRIRLQKWRELRLEEFDEPVRGSESNEAARLRARAERDVLDGIGFLDRRARMLIDLLPAGGDVDAAGRAFEEPDVEPLFEEGHATADTRFGNTKDACSLREAP